MTDRDPDYVVLGARLLLRAITRAIRLIAAGAPLIATNPDPSGPSQHGVLPHRPVAVLISTRDPAHAMLVGKPNPLMMQRTGTGWRRTPETTTVMISRMDTDIISGLEAGLRTVLVTTRSTRPEQVETFPYRPPGWSARSPTWWRRGSMSEVGAAALPPVVV